jgi:hypothetical protein
MAITRVTLATVKSSLLCGTMLSRVLKQVEDCGFKDSGVVCEVPQAEVAVFTQQAADKAGTVVMVNRKQRLKWRATTNRTLMGLRLKHLLVPLRLKPIFLGALSLALLICRGGIVGSDVGTSRFTLHGVFHALVILLAIEFGHVFSPTVRAIVGTASLVYLRLLKAFPLLAAGTRFTVKAQPVSTCGVFIELVSRLFYLAGGTLLACGGGILRWTCSHSAGLITSYALPIQPISFGAVKALNAQKDFTGRASLLCYNVLSHGVNLLERFVLWLDPCAALTAFGSFCIHAAGRILTALSASVPAYSLSSVSAARTSNYTIGGQC